jgi:hypothetical protein
MRQAPRPDVDGWGPGIPPALLKVQSGTPARWVAAKMPPPEEPMPRTRAPCSFAWFTFGPHSGRSHSLANPARSFACLEMAPMLWEPSSRLPATGIMDSADAFRQVETRSRARSAT